MGLEEQGPRWVGALRHERIELLSYPAEWSFGMLRRAALLHLDLFLDALDEGLVIKDSSAYNIQWRGTEPVFIDVPSFQKVVPGEPWIGYLQFCEQFLYPLLLTAKRDVPFQTWLRGSLEGISAHEMNRLLGPIDRLRPGLFAHVYLQAKLAGATAAKPQAIRKEVRDLGFGVELIRTNVRRMRKLVSKLEWRRSESEWSTYSTTHNYEPEERAQKEAFVRRAASQRPWRELWDLGGNTGHFTRLAAAHAERSVALDIDPLVVDLSYRQLVEEGNPQGILPLVTDLLDPFSDRGWRGLERKGLFRRARPDLLLALALVHHLVIGRNVPMEEVLDWLAAFGAHLVVELPTREDSMVERLLLNRDEHVQEYSLESFERLLSERFEVLEREPLHRGARVLYFVRPRE
ncbi:MAG: methyltransferase [Acidobacteriota bacterium]